MQERLEAANTAAKATAAEHCKAQVAQMLAEKVAAAVAEVRADIADDEFGYLSSDEAAAFRSELSAIANKYD